MKKPKEYHLALNRVNGLSACGVYEIGNTTDIEKVTCSICKKRISLIWTISEYGIALRKLKDELKKISNDIDEFYLFKI